MKAMKWTENMILIEKNGITGSCPVCGSENTGLFAERVKDTMGYMQIYCNECGNGCHISRADISDKLLKLSKRPNMDITFE